MNSMFWKLVRSISSNSLGQDDDTTGQDDDTPQVLTFFGGGARVIEKQRTTEEIVEHFRQAGIKRDYADPYVWKNLQFIRESPSGERALEMLAISQGQFSELAVERETLLARLKEIDATEAEIRKTWESDEKAVQIVLNRRKNEASLEIGESINKVLLPHQARLLSNWHPDHKGIFYILAGSPIGIAIGISENDQKRMSNELAKLGDKYAQSYIDTVVEARRIVEKYVPEDQLERLEKHYYPNRSDNLISESLKGDVIMRNLVRYGSPYRARAVWARRGTEVKD